jgi:hypothetical protein
VSNAQDPIFHRVICIDDTKLLTRLCRQALLINNLSFVVEGYSEKYSSITFDDDTCDHIFSPLKEWEQPKSVHSGSGYAVQRPFHHIWWYMRQSLSTPWPFGGHPTGIRQTQLPAPPRQASTNPLRAPLYHHRSSLVKRLRHSITGSRTFQVSDHPSIRSMTPSDDGEGNSEPHPVQLQNP